MQNKTSLSGYAGSCLLASALLFAFSCKREIVPPAEKAEAVQSTSINARVASLFASPVVFPVQTGIVSTLIGGPVNASAFSAPVYVATDKSGNLYVSDQQLNVIKKISAAGVILAQFGNGHAGYQDGPVASAQFNFPQGIAVAPDGRVLIADALNNRIRFINAAGDSVGTLAGSGVAGFADGAGTVARFYQPSGLAVDANGVIYIADALNNMIRRITSGNHVTRWAGQTVAGSQDGTGSLASFNNPQGLAVSPSGAVYVADQNNNKIRKIVSGTVTTYAGNGTLSLIDGPGASASFQFPSSVAVDATGNLYVTELFDNVRFVTAAGLVSTLAGQGIGFADGTGPAASFKNPSSITLSPDGNIYIVDRGNRAVRKMSLVSAVKTLTSMDASSAFIPTTCMAAGPDGCFYSINKAGRVIKINPYTSAGSYVGSITAGAGSSITLDAQANIVIVDPVGKFVQKLSPLGVPLSYFANLDGAYKSPVTDGAGNIYVISDRGRLARITGINQVTYTNLTGFTDMSPVR